MDYLVDTIAAISTPYGIGGLGVIRVSGPEALEIVDRVFFAYNRQSLVTEPGYTMRLGTVIIDEKKIDEVIVLVFKEPRSYTGEDVVEIQCHGGPVVLDTILRSLVDNGARIAFPGEFTRRAVVNGRISLSEAEGIGEVISAVSKQGEQAAFALSKGSLFREIKRMKGEILTLQSSITAFIDFPEEDVEEINEEEMMVSLSNLKQSLKALLDSYETGLVILNGIPTVIAGSPNVGKSTIMNLLSGYEKAIVTPIAGTTRDILEHRITVDGIPLILSDTAGIHLTDNIVEKIGVSKAYDTIENSSLILAIFDNSRELSEDDYTLLDLLKGRKVLAIVNKIDLERKLKIKEIENNFSNVIYISANDESSLKILTEEIKRVVGLDSFSSDMAILVNERQRSAAVGAYEAVSGALNALIDGFTVDVIYVSLDNALSSLLELSGENVSEAVLDEVFSNFCVGK